MAWLQLRIQSQYPEFAEEILLSHGALAVSFIDAEDDPVLEPGPGETPLWNNTVALGLFADTTEPAPIEAALQEQLPDGASIACSRELIEDQDWVRVWLKDCPPLKFGERLWVCPREKRVDEAGAVTLILDPGLAFGTGTHPSTALCLEWLSTNDIDGSKVLDFGCGSGILAIAALKLGAAQALCTDIDPQAITATLDNAADNGVGARLRTIAADESFVPFPADLILANILARPLIQLAPLLASSLRPGGRIVLAGLLDRQAEEVRSAYSDWIEFDPDVSKEGWTRLAGYCRMPALINQLRIAPHLVTAGQPQAEHFAVLAQAGYEVVINLATPASPNALPDEAAIVRGNGMQYEALPVDWDRPAIGDFQRFRALMDSLDSRKRLVHCALNFRASAFVFLWRVLSRGESARDAARDLYKIWAPNETWAAFMRECLAEQCLELPAKL